MELKVFSDEPSAWVARAVLEANGIPSQVLTDPPYAHPLPRVRLAVRAGDAKEAFRLLQATSDGPSA